MIYRNYRSYVIKIKTYRSLFNRFIEPSLNASNVYNVSIETENSEKKLSVESMCKENILRKMEDKMLFRSILNLVGFIFGYGNCGFYDIYDSNNFKLLIKNNYKLYEFKYDQIKLFQNPGSEVVDDMLLDYIYFNKDCV